MGTDGQSWRERVQPYRERWYDSFGHEDAQGAYILPFSRAFHTSAPHNCPGAGVRQGHLEELRQDTSASRPYSLPLGWESLVLPALQSHHGADMIEAQRVSTPEGAAQQQRGQSTAHMVEVTPSRPSQWQSYEGGGVSPLAAARVSPGAAQMQVASSHRESQLTGARTSPERLTSLTALPTFVSLVPVRLPFPPLPPRPPKGSASADTHASTGAGPTGSAPYLHSSKQVVSRDLHDKKIRLSCDAWLKTPTSRRLFTGDTALPCCNRSLHIP